MATPPTPTTTDNSSGARKVTIPVAAGAVTILCVIALHVINAPISNADLAVGAPALSTLLTFLGDYFLPDRFLA